MTILQMPSGRYFAVLNIDFEPKFQENQGHVIGLDIGLHSFYTDSNGRKVENPGYLKQSLRRLRRAQKCLSRRQKGSSNWGKHQRKTARIYEKVSDQRKDFLQKLSTALVHENQIICVEDLNVKGMIRNKRLARSVSDASWSKFLSMLDYKGTWYGTKIIRVSRWYPSSQICSNCGYRNPEIKDLKVRKWTCPACGSYHDRDGNAARNILREGLKTA